MKYTIYGIMHVHPNMRGNCSEKFEINSADTKKEAFKLLKSFIAKEYTSKDVFFTIEKEEN